MRCFGKQAVDRQSLQDQVKWLHRMLSKEQRSKQAVLGQLQDERAKSAMLEMEILHAAQAAQEMGESLCLFFNPCYQQHSKQQVLLPVHCHPGSGDLLLQPPMTSQQQQQHEFQQQLQGQGVQLRGDASTCQQSPQQEQATPQHPSFAVLDEQHQQQQASDDIISDPDTTAHDQTPTKLRGSVVLTASSEHPLAASGTRLQSPSCRRSLKLSPAGCRASPRKRPLTCNSLRLSAVANNSHVQAAHGDSCSADHSSSLRQQRIITGGFDGAPAAAAEQAASMSAAAHGAAASNATVAGLHVMGDVQMTNHDQHNSDASQAPDHADNQQQQRQVASICYSCQAAEGEAAAGSAGDSDTCSHSATERAAAGRASSVVAAEQVQQQQQQVEQPQALTLHSAPAAAPKAAWYTGYAAAGPLELGVSEHSTSAQAAAASRVRRAARAINAAAAAAAAIQECVSAASAAVAAAHAACGQAKSSATCSSSSSKSLPAAATMVTPAGFTAPASIHTLQRELGDVTGYGSSSGSGGGWGVLPHQLLASVIAEPHDLAAQPTGDATAGAAAAAAAGPPRHVACVITDDQEQQRQQKHSQASTGGGVNQQEAESGCEWMGRSSGLTPPVVCAAEPGSAAQKHSTSGTSRSTNCSGSVRSRHTNSAATEPEIGSNSSVNTTAAASQASVTWFVDVPQIGATKSAAVANAASTAGARAIKDTAAPVRPNQENQHESIEEVAAVSARAEAATAAGVLAADAAYGTPQAAMADPPIVTVPVSTLAASQTAPNAGPATTARLAVPPLAGGPRHINLAHASTHPAHGGAHLAHASTQPAHGGAHLALASGQLGHGPAPVKEGERHRLSKTSSSCKAPPSAAAAAQQQQQVWHMTGWKQPQGTPSLWAGAGVGPMHAAVGGQVVGVSSSRGSSSLNWHAGLGTAHRQCSKLAAASQQPVDTTGNSRSGAEPAPSGGKSSTLHLGALQTCSWRQQQRQQQPQLVHPRAQKQQMWRHRHIYDVLTHDSNKPFGDGETLLPVPASLRHSAGSGAATASSFLAARPAAAAGAAVSAREAALHLQAVQARAAAAVPSSCLSPLHWHQANLGSSSAKFFSTMMLAACSNPALVMQQQMTFERPDIRVRPVTRLPRGDRGYSRGLLSGSSKSRKSGWKALF